MRIMTCRDFNCPKNFSVSAGVTEALLGLLASQLVLGTTLQLVARLTVKLVLVVLAELLPPSFALTRVVSVYCEIYLQTYRHDMTYSVLKVPLNPNQPTNPVVSVATLTADLWHSLTI